MIDETPDSHGHDSKIGGVAEKGIATAPVPADAVDGVCNCLYF